MRDEEFIADADEDEEELEETSNSNDMAEVTAKASKAWRSIERYREMKQLQQHLDDLLFEGNPEDLRDLHW
ncbi:MAG: hypothetical protein H6970_02545 [Gammaproteobacteria bacterium]|nr:hypothetical protein [Gammaproteobacteria bacterium]MCP5459416.1 hypothetical protein [Gammaproteobacteria bacterium]